MILDLEIELTPSGNDEAWCTSVGDGPLVYHMSLSLALSYLRSRIIAQRDALLRVVPVDEWLPIESAPKDDKPVLLLISDGIATVGEWCGTSETWDSQYVTTGEYRDPNEYGPTEDGEVWVTHWRPLPEPPKEMR